MAQAAKAHEPSMEEILASIRRIIADDDGAKPPVRIAMAPEPPPLKAAPAAAPPDPPPLEAEPGDDIDAVLAGIEDPAPETLPEPAEPVLDLTEAMAAPEPEPPRPSFRRIEPDPDVGFSEPASTRSHPPQPGDPPLLSPAATAAVNSAFGTLAHSVLVQNSRTLEDLVKEMLRPMLKTWLDDNLPKMVERLVRAEIERVSRGQPG